MYIKRGRGNTYEDQRYVINKVNMHHLEYHYQLFILILNILLGVN